MKRFITSKSILLSCFFALAMMFTAQSAWAEYVPLTALSGTKSLTDGEGVAKLVDTFDGRDGRASTKWGQSFDTSNPDRNQAWVIVKAEKAFTPENYFLVTGNDTNGDQKRNWRNWNIYGANFESDEAAVFGAEAWVLIDQREDGEVSVQNYGVTQYKLNDGLSLVTYDGTPYQYYLIEVTRAMEDTDVYLQMNEFGFGTYAEFESWCEIQAADPTKPVSYRSIAGSPAGFSNEGFANLINGNTTDKWCCGFTNREEGETENGGYIVFKASRPIAPTYYSLVTGGDTGGNPGRNWKQWQIYGMNASSDADVKRESDQWVAIDKKYAVGTNQLPAANYALAYFTLSEGNTEAYKYFKIEIDQVVTSGLMQMSEFALGDANTLAIERATIINGMNYDPDVFAEKALLDQMGALIDEINACEDVTQIGTLSKRADELVAQLKTSVNQYAELITVRNQAIKLLEAENLTDAAMAYAQAWISETDAVAPGTDYPVGNFAYIKANRQLTGDEASAEAKRFSAYLQNNVKVVDDPIGDVGYVFVSGTTDNWAGSEGPESLIDGDRNGTKWGTATSGDRFIIFKSNEPIKPTYYGLVTGGDTDKYKDRNWRNWKIWAANFEEGEFDTETEEGKQAMRESDKWVLIDEKENVGTDVLKTTSLFESYINLSIGCSEPYEYFKIEVYHDGGMQMNEFTFYNQGDFNIYKDDFVSQFEDYDPEENPAYIGYINAYKEKYAELQNAAYAPELMKIKNELVDLQEQLARSAELYSIYEDVYEELVSVGAASEELKPWFDGYTGENLAPSNVYINGTHDYIMENLSLDNDAIGNLANPDDANSYATGEIGYIQNMIDAATDGVYILLGGHTEGQWGDGYYGHLIDGIALNTTTTEIDPETGEEKTVTVKATKWGGNADGNGNTYIIFRTLDKTNPFFYTLTTGNDTGSYKGRNWGTWYIYGANFEGDGDATKDAEGWVLIDAKENVGQDRLHPVDAQPSYFGFSTETTEKYTYYKVVVTKAYSGAQIQMNELHFGTPEEFEELKDEYKAAAEEFDYDVIAEQSLLDAYQDGIEDIQECQNMEALFRVNYDLEELRDKITESVATYMRYITAVEDNKTYLENNALAESEALTFFSNYLNTSVEASEGTYPNGSAPAIIYEHELADSVIVAELDYMESLKVAAVAAGYGPGMDISSLIVNRTFKNAGESLKDEAGNNIGREAEGWDGNIFRTATDDEKTVYAAEFCNELAKFDVSQTLNDMKNGYYKVTLNAAYRANGDLLSYNYAPLAYANDVKTFVPVIREDAIELKEDSWQGIYPDREVYYNAPEDSTEYGWGMWGCEGAANAFRQGHYAITLIAQVTDGTLTIGLKNDGTKGNEWTAAGNFGLWYLGETADEASLQEVADYNAARINTLTELYVSSIDSENYTDAPGFAAAQKAALAELSGVATFEAAKTVGETFEAISLTKQAYATLYETYNMVYDKWGAFGSADIDALDEEIGKIQDALVAGDYDAEAALAKAEALLEQYPDYMEVVAYNENVDVAENDEEAFNYVVTSYGRNPSVKIGGHFYDKLAADEVIFAFEYSSTKDLLGSRFYIGKDADDTQMMDSIAVVAAPELTKAYIDLSKAVKEWGFGNTDDEIRWRFTAGESDVEVGIRHARMITKAQMKAEGGKPLNVAVGDVNGDTNIDVADAVSVLNIMADGSNDPAADVNGDGNVDIADFVSVLNVMAEQ